MGYCTWAGMNEANRIYHDTEWGIPVHDDRHMFEHLTLECLQCGLNWELMLKKREIFRQCFDNFDFDKIAAYDDFDVERIKLYPGKWTGIVHFNPPVNRILLWFFTSLSV